jgi:hypothetical protein
MSTINKKKEWRQKNLEKLADYARSYYYKRIENDPDYKKKLCEKVKINKAKRDGIDINAKKKPGRPRIYKEKLTNLDNI